MRLGCVAGSDTRQCPLFAGDPSASISVGAVTPRILDPSSTRSPCCTGSSCGNPEVKDKSNLKWVSGTAASSGTVTPTRVATAAPRRCATTRTSRSVPFVRTAHCLRGASVRLPGQEQHLAQDRHQSGHQRQRHDEPDHDCHRQCRPESSEELEVGRQQGSGTCGDGVTGDGDDRAVRGYRPPG